MSTLEQCNFENHSHPQFNYTQIDTSKSQNEIVFSVNDSVLDKTDNFEALTNGYKQVLGTVSDIASMIRKGYAISAGNMLNFPNLKRTKKNFSNSQIVLIDIDNSRIDEKGRKVYCQELTLSQALEHPFIKEFASLIYTTKSHSESWNRFRVLFILPFPITVASQYEKVVRKLLKAFPAADSSCTDAMRVFYGNQNASIPLLREDVRLTQDWVEDAILSEDLEAAPKKNNFSGEGEISKQDLTLGGNYKGNAEIARAILLKLNPSLMSWEEWRDCLLAFHNAELSTQEVLEFSRGSHKHTDSGFYSVWNNIKGSVKPVTIYTLLSRYSIKTKGNKAKNSDDEARREKIKKYFSNRWNESKTYTADLKVNMRYCSADLLLEAMEKYDIIGVRFIMDQGKTQAIKKLCRMLNCGMLVLTPRNLLGIQTAATLTREDYSVYHLQRDDAYNLLPDRSSRIVCCPDSLYRFKMQDLEREVLVLDEATSTVVHSLLSSTMKQQGNHNRIDLLNKFEEAVKRAKKIILLDGNLSDLVVSYIQDLRGCHKDRVVKIENIRPGKTLDIQLITAIDEKGAEKRTQASPLLKRILDYAEELKRIPLGQARCLVVISDWQTQLAALEKLLIDKGLTGERIDSETTGDKNKKYLMELIENPNSYLKDNQLQYLLMSPSTEMGFDASIENYFSKGFALFYGIVPTDSQMQFMRRARNCLNWEVWCSEYCNFARTSGKKNHYSSSDIIKELIELKKINFDLTFDGDLINPIREHLLEQIEGVNSNIHVKYAAEILAMQAYESSNTRFCYITRARKAGWEITEISELKEDITDKLVKTEREEVIAERANRIFNSEDISIEEARSIRKSGNASQEDWDKSRKAILKDRLPGIEETSLWNAEFVADVEIKKSINLREIERYWLIQHLDTAEAIDKKSWIEKLSYIADPLGVEGDESLNWMKQLRIKNVFIPDITSDFPLLHSIKATGLWNLIEKSHETGESFSNESESIVSVYNKIKHSKKYQLIFGKKPEKMTVMQFVQSIAAKIGVKTKFSHLEGEKKNSKRFYTFETPDKDDVLGVIYECVSKKLGKKADEIEDKKLLTFPVQVHFSSVSTENCKAVYNVIEIGENVPDEDLEDLKNMVESAKMEEDKNIATDILCLASQIASECNRRYSDRE